MLKNDKTIVQNKGAYHRAAAVPFFIEAMGKNSSLHPTSFVMQMP